MSPSTSIVPPLALVDAPGIQGYILWCLEKDPAVFPDDGAVRIDNAFLRYQAAVDPDLAALGDDLPEVHRPVLRRAHDDGDVGIEGIDQLHAMARRKDHIALGRIDDPAVLDIRRDQVNLPARGRRNGPLVLNGPGHGARR